jgi:hypothetical protein
MSRPKPAILLSRIDPRTFKAEQVLKANAIYAVFFDGQPINLRSVHTASDIVGPKYKKVSFSNPGHAFNLCEKLNKLFKTDRFAVHRLIDGENVVETNEEIGE